MWCLLDSSAVLWEAQSRQVSHSHVHNHKSTYLHCSACIFEFKLELQDASCNISLFTGNYVHMLIDNFIPVASCLPVLSACGLSYAHMLACLVSCSHLHEYDVCAGVF